MAEREGQHLGNYRLLKLLGQGGFAEVYLGEHIHLDTKAAIKLLHTHIMKNELALFQQEARTLARLVHPNIVRVLEFGIDAQSNTPYLVMDYAPGGTLRQRHPKGTHLPLPTVVEYVKQIAAALQYAHDEKLIHRDVKPENILLGPNGELLLSDFGITVLSPTGRTSPNPPYGPAGTPSYMAPEQIMGKPEKASDQYALAVMVYEWLCGKLPFSEGNALNIQYQHIHEPALPPHDLLPTLPPAVEWVILNALAKQPGKRFGSVHTFATALEQASGGDTAFPGRWTASKPVTLFVPPAQPSSFSAMSIQPLHSPLRKPSEMVTPTRRRLSRRAVVLVAASIVGVGIVGTGIWWLTHRPGTLYVTYRRHSGPVIALAWSPNGTRIASGSYDRTLQMWDAATGNTIFIHHDHYNGLGQVAWSPDSKRVASASAERTVQVLDAATQGIVFTYHGHTHPVYGVAWSPAGTRIASGGEDQTVQVWDADDGGNVLTYRGHAQWVEIVVWSPDGTRIASAGDDYTVQVWDAATGDSIVTYRGHTSGVWAVAWSPDGKHIVSGSWDQTVQVWDATNGGNVLTYGGHSDGVIAVAWSPDGKRIASASGDKTVQVWDAANGGNVFIYRGHASGVWAVAWSPDGGHVASGSWDQTVQVWQAVEGL